MCKAPKPGRTKSRLAAKIGAEAAASLSACFLCDVAAAVEAVPKQLGRRGYGIYAPAGGEAELRRLLPPTFGLLLQADEEFGNVLFGAMRDLLAAGHDSVLLVNGDSPTLPQSFLVQALTALRQPGDRMVLGPASDGGYYLIGLKNPHRHLFTGIRWGTDTVTRRTLARATEIGLSAKLLPEWYDIDDLETLGWLREELSGGSTRFRGGGAAVATRAFFSPTTESPPRDTRAVPKSARRILVTGATGLIGSELCGQLVERGHAVIAVVHRRHEIVRNNGSVLHPAASTGKPPGYGALQWAAGDVSKPGLGLEAKEAVALASAVELIIHCAAETRFSAAPELHRAVNVEGTRNVISFARASRGSVPGLVHVSTAYVNGECSGHIAEEELDAEQPFANSYETSKAAAEKLLRASGLRAAIARPSIIVGTSDTGTIGRFENLYGLLRLIGDGRITLLPSTPDASLDLVPIDHVIGGLIDIIENFELAAGKIFHLVSGDPAPLAALTALDYPGFHVPRLVPAEQFDLSQLNPAERLVYQSVTSAYATYLRRNPRFAAQNLAALSGRVCPPTGHQFLRRVVEYATAAGYLQPNSAPLTGGATSI